MVMKRQEQNNPLSFPEKNLLSLEKSPYLLQHADNPVYWYPWGEQAFAKAQAEDKPVFLSIGYSTCHWCHVMEHESFENDEIAGIMNTYFVSIKVDREERSDIDNIYMKAVMAITGQGGWPLSVFLTPDKKPFYGGTYFPPEPRWGSPGFKELLLSVHAAWQDKRADLIRSSESIAQSLRDRSRADPQNIAVLPDQKTLEEAFRQFYVRFDTHHGGFGQAPKFPSSHNLSFLLRYWKRTQDPGSLEMVKKTLTAMAQGGMYDQVGGGFHRYSTDREWQIPHFEKMLYDQALLAKTYLEAYQATREQEYARVAQEIFNYVLRDMTDAQGGFYSAEDADSLPPETPQSGRKIEGAFYLWREKEILEHLGQEEAWVFNFFYGIEVDGNARFDPHGEFVGKNILYGSHSLEETSSALNKSVEVIKNSLAQSRGKLFKVRKARPRPHLDDKVLVDWNGLMISSLAFGSRVLNELKYREAARKAADFLLTKLVRKDGRLLHRYRDGQAQIFGTLDDYAFLIHGLVDLYEATFEPQYLAEAKQLTEDMIRLFWDEQEGGFYFTGSDAEKILVREKELYDGAIPSGNSIAALDLLRMGRMTSSVAWERKAAQLFKSFGREITAAPSAFAQVLTALDFALGPSQEIVLVGQKDDRQTQAMVKILYEHFIPNKIVILCPVGRQARGFIASVPFVKNYNMLDGKTTAYVCEDYHCLFPTNDVKRFGKLLK